MPISPFLHGLENEITTVSGNLTEQEALPAVQHLIQNYSTSTQKIQFDIFNGMPYQLVAVPIKAPIIIGWMVVGFEIDDVLAQKINKLSNLQVTFIQHTKSKSWVSNASTLAADDQRIVTRYFSQGGQSDAIEHEMDVGGELYETKYLILHDNQDEKLLAVLQRSVTAEISQFQAMKYSLFMLTILGLGVFSVAIIYVSNYIVAPITKLSDNAKQLEYGNYEAEIETNRIDEIGELSKSFNAMRAAIATREERVKRLAFSDEITGLPNRAAFIQQLGDSILRAS